jgi:hypothetical protein
LLFSRRVQANLGYQTLKQALKINDEQHPCRKIGKWITSFLMSSHPDLGRSGDVCPFTGHAARIDTIRIGVYEQATVDVSAVTDIMREACRQVRTMPCSRSMRHFATVVIGFPNATTHNELDKLAQVQDNLKFHTLLHGLMIGRFHSASEVEGLWNRDFRPLRSPIPLLAVRHLVESDGAFVIRRPLLVPTYLLKFPFSAPKHLLAKYLRSRKIQAAS